MQDRSDFDEAFICIRDRPRQNQIKMSLKTSLEDVHKIGRVFESIYLNI